MSPEESFKGEGVARFISKIAVQDDGCWLWTSSLQYKGYGTFWGGEGSVYAHRWAYEHSVGAVPDGLELDHLCRVRACVNPGHLEAVTHAENCRRRPLGPIPATCKRGHDLSGENLFFNTYGYRMCRACTRETQRAARARKRAA